MWEEIDLNQKRLSSVFCEAVKLKSVFRARRQNLCTCPYVNAHEKMQRTSARAPHARVRPRIPERACKELCTFSTHLGTCVRYCSSTLSSSVCTRSRLECGAGKVRSGPPRRSRPPDRKTRRSRSRDAMSAARTPSGFADTETGKTCFDQFKRIVYKSLLASIDLRFVSELQRQWPVTITNRFVADSPNTII